jgi:hypothetical protein
VLLAKERLDVLAQDAMDATDLMGAEFSALDEALDGADGDLHQTGCVRGGVDRPHRRDEWSALIAHIDLQDWRGFVAISMARNSPLGRSWRGLKPN